MGAIVGLAVGKYYSQTKLSLLLKRPQIPEAEYLDENYQALVSCGVWRRDYMLWFTLCAEEVSERSEDFSQAAAGVQSYVSPNCPHCLRNHRLCSINTTEVVITMATRALDYVYR